MTVVAGPPSDAPSCDVCIVGSGPVGIALALECERNGLSVLALEAGSERESWFRRSERASEQSTSDNHVPIHLATRRAFGGTSWAWSGGCARFDDIDFEVREHVPYSGWPLSHSAVEPFYERAASILCCRPVDALPSNGLWSGLEWISADTTVSISTQPRLGAAYWNHFRNSKAITLCLNSPVVGLELDERGEHVAAVRVASRGHTHLIRAPRFVLAAGGLRTTQLLLATQRHWPGHFGGPGGALGRFYMGHLTGCLSSIRFDSPADADQFYSQMLGGERTAQRRFTIDTAKQKSERLLSIAFWPSAPLIYDPAHADGTLSAAFLVFAVPKLGNWLMEGVPRHVYMGPRPRRFGAHIRNIIRAPVQTSVGSLRALFNELMSRPSIGLRAWKAGLGAYSLHYHAESEPNPESRVTIGDKIDGLGLPRLQINLLFSETDARSVIKAHDVLDSALRKAGKARLEYLVPPDERGRSVLEQAKDGYHQMGTTRMGNDPRSSVVDHNCRVHDLANLFVASSSVFPTAGHANPTLLATAFAVRLARHLAATAGRG